MYKSEFVQPKKQQKHMESRPPVYNTRKHIVLIKLICTVTVDSQLTDVCVTANTMLIYVSCEDGSFLSFLSQDISILIMITDNKMQALKILGRMKCTESHRMFSEFRIGFSSNGNILSISLVNDSYNITAFQFNF